ncbi:dual specificity protein phosphatase 14 [Clonorchis sinensis]|uniref:Dual specificity protein phosphatase 14 n=1 Tax=Clonorchis sinensis TaxID=79923 RepID=H2KQA2_CLOSI|nr:dual specificity protein phosphatase 14 [Clonorchis sinensis]
MDRFSTTYSRSYRPFDEFQRNIPLRCLNGTQTSSTLLNGSRSPGVARLARCWPSDLPASQTTSFASSVGDTCSSTSTYAIYQPPFTRSANDNDSPGFPLSWDVSKPIIDKQRPTPPSMCASSTTANRLGFSFDDTVTSGLSSISTCATNKDCASSSSTVISADKLNACHGLSNGVTEDLTFATKTPLLFCAPQARTLPTISNTVGCNSDIGSDLTHGNCRKIPVTTERAVTVNPTSPPPGSQLDFTQMYSQVARINNHLYLSSLNALTPDRLRQYGITLLVSAMVDPPPAQLRNAVISSMHVAVEDMEGANLRAHFDRVGDRIASEQRRGGRTLVHCMAGVSRSSSLVLAYLMRHMNMTLADAYQHVRSIRPCIQPNPSFWRQLLEYEERIHGRRSVRLLPPVGYMGSCGISPTSRLYSGDRPSPRTSHLDMYSRPTSDLLPYRPITSMHSLDSGKPYVGCRQPLG